MFGHTGSQQQILPKVNLNFPFHSSVLLPESFTIETEKESEIKTERGRQKEKQSESKTERYRELRKREGGIRRERDTLLPVFSFLP